MTRRFGPLATKWNCTLIFSNRSSFNSLLIKASCRSAIARLVHPAALTVTALLPTPSMSWIRSSRRLRTDTACIRPWSAFREFPVPTPGHGQVLVQMKASSICGSDIRAIYRAHLGKGPEGYQSGTIGGHEPCGQILEVGSDCREFKVGDRVILYHIAGCGLCEDCKAGYMISCHSELRQAYG